MNLSDIEHLDKKRCLDRWYPLIDHPVQEALITDLVRFKVVPAGRRCLAEGTLVTTPRGPIPIEKLQVGDYVVGFDEHHKAALTYVNNTWDNGEQEVIALMLGGQIILEATANHKLWCKKGNTFARVELSRIRRNTRIVTADGCLVSGFYRAGKRIAKTYDITVANQTNLYCLDSLGIVTSNSGKTERAKRYIIKQAMKIPGRYFVAAPTRDQVRQIYWEDLKLLSFCILFPKPPSESHLTIFFPNGSTIVLIGLDKPQRVEGVVWTGGVIDEIADVKEGAWELNISPALDTFNPMNPTYRAWCWLIGVPEGLNHYYDLAEYARTANDPQWKFYTWLSADILPPDVIEAAKRRMSPKQYKQEYEASFETASGKIYEDYGPHNHTNEMIQPHEQLMWMHDFNFTPLSSAVGVRRGNDLYILDEIVLISAISRQSALEFIERYKNHQNRKLILYGDPAGRAGEKHGHNSDYNEMENLLKVNNWQVERRVKAAAPAIKDRQNAVRAKMLNAAGETSLFVNPAKAPYAHKGFSTVQFKEGSTFQEEETQYQHITTAMGYCIAYEWPITIIKEPIHIIPQGSVNHWNTKHA